MNAHTNEAAASQETERQTPSAMMPTADWSWQGADEDDVDEAPEEAGYGYGV